MLRKIKNSLFSVLVPSKLKFTILDLKLKLLSGKRKSYAQHGEDFAIGQFFNNKSDGFYVDVGAHHPKRYSNTYLLHKSGWQGINFDANPQTIELFKRDRPGDKNLLAGIGKENMEMTYWMFSDPAVNTFSETEAKKWLDKSWIKLIDKKRIRIKTLADVLKNNLPSNQTIDLLNVDVEGLDLSVLESNDWEKFRPKLIVVETETSKETSRDIYKFMEANGYGFYTRLGLSSFFRKNKD